jgi:23S rRNA (guanosine2251-2'-O)-methyltransferase
MQKTKRTGKSDRPRKEPRSKVVKLSIPHYGVHEKHGEWLYGRQAVRETLRAAHRTAQELIVAEGSEERGVLAEIMVLCRQQKIPIERAPRMALDRVNGNHQGVALLTTPYPYASLIDILADCESKETKPLILLLDQIQDPQNLGSLLRTAEAVGVDGVVMPVHRAAGITPAVVNASSGASEHLRIAQANLTQTIEELKRRNIWVAGLDIGPDTQPAFETDLSMPLALVVGSEGEGVRPLVRRSCDLLLQLPIHGKVESLNAAVAGSIALYLVLRARTKRETALPR